MIRSDLLNSIAYEHGAETVLLAQKVSDSLVAFL